MRRHLQRVQSVNHVGVLGAAVAGATAFSLLVAHLSSRIDLRAAAVTAFGFYGRFDRVWRPGHTRAVAVAAAITTVWGVGFRLAQRRATRATLPPWSAPPAWRAAAAAAMTTAIWNLTLVLTSGEAELTRIVNSRFDYRRVALQIDDPGEFLRTFVDSLPDYTVHVKGHPPLFPLLLWAAHRAGLDAAGFEAAALIGSWSLAVAGVVAIAGRMGTTRDAWFAAPLVATMPAVVWAGISADAFIAAVVVWTTWTVLVATDAGTPLSDHGRRGSALGATAIRTMATAAAGVGVGATLLLSYGAPILLIPAAAIALRQPRRAAAVAAIAGIIIAETARRGFWWFDGLSAVRHYYDAGIASERPRWFFSLSNLSVAAWAVGPAVLIGMVAAARRGTTLYRLVVGSVAFAVVAANASGMSKAEVERIWLPLFALSGIAVIAVSRVRRPHAYGAAALAVNLAIGLALEWMLRLNW